MSSQHNGHLRVSVASFFMFLLVGNSVAPIPPMITYFNNLRDRCEGDTACTRRVGLCQNDQLLQTYKGNFQSLRADCIQNNPEEDPDLCAHVQIGDYRADGTMNTDALRDHFEESFSDEADLLGDLVSRVGLCDQDIAASDYLNCVLEGCLLV